MEVLDDDRRFVEAVSLCAELEGLCLDPESRPMLAYVGLARCELTDYGTVVPRRLERVPVPSAQEGIRSLDKLLTSLIEGSADLQRTLRLHEAREILREGVARLADA
jgi:hypothetical protein